MQFVELETKVDQKFRISPFVIVSILVCLFVCFYALFVSFWCSPIIPNIIYCCLCDIYLAKSKKRPRRRCVTPTKTSVKQFARGVSLFGWFSYHYFVLFVLQLFVDIVCYTINNICILCQVAFTIWNSIFWLFSDAPSALTAFQITGLIALKIIPKYPTEQLITQQPMTYPEIFQQDSQEVCWYLK